ncbi:MAG: hypothetical protein LBB76_03805 [Azoarcus sp.]|jgi:4-diphosphocytidyl-2C-methyl-D-erythritol kinase|nr:hypothetical protein [Azoarcus sp.]
MDVKTLLRAAKACARMSGSGSIMYSVCHGCVARHLENGGDGVVDA